MTERYFLDSNIIMYAIGGPHALKSPCQRVIELVEQQQLHVVTNTEVIQEILYRYTAINRRALAVETGNLVMDIVEETFSVTADDMRLAGLLVHKHAQVNVRDAVHAATMIQHRVRSILTADRHFDQFTQLRRIDPKRFG